MYAEDYQQNVQPLRDYCRIPSARIGASFDFHAQTPDGPVIVECKNVDFIAFRNGWTVTDDFVEAPAHIEFQAQHQMLVSGYKFAVIVVLIGGNDLRVLYRYADAAIHAAILRKTAEFWRSIDSGTAPDPVFPGDAEAIIRQCSFAEPGRVLDLRQDVDAIALFNDLREAKARVADAELAESEAKARMLLRIGDAEKAIFPAGTITASMTAPSDGKLVTADMVGSYVGARAGYRNFRLNAKKGV
jgi:hypothetical protein